MDMYVMGPYVHVYVVPGTMHDRVLKDVCVW